MGNRVSQLRSKQVAGDHQHINGLDRTKVTTKTNGINENCEFAGLLIGCLVLCHDEFRSKYSGALKSKWRSAEIIDVDGMNVLVHFTSWSFKYDTWIDLSAECTRLAPLRLLSMKQREAGLPLTEEQMELSYQFLVTGRLPPEYDINASAEGTTDESNDTDTMSESCFSGVSQLTRSTSFGNLSTAQSSSIGGSHTISTRDFYSVGQKVHVQDIFRTKRNEVLRKWRDGEIVEVRGSCVKVHYVGWDSKWDIMIDIVKNRDRVRQSDGLVTSLSPDELQPQGPAAAAAPTSASVSESTVASSICRQSLDIDIDQEVESASASASISVSTSLSNHHQPHPRRSLECCTSGDATTAAAALSPLHSPFLNPISPQTHCRLNDSPNTFCSSGSSRRSSFASCDSGDQIRPVASPALGSTPLMSSARMDSTKSDSGSLPLSPLFTFTTINSSEIDTGSRSSLGHTSMPATGFNNETAGGNEKVGRGNASDHVLFRGRNGSSISDGDAGKIDRNRVNEAILAARRRIGGSHGSNGCGGVGERSVSPAASIGTCSSSSSRHHSIGKCTGDGSYTAAATGDDTAVADISTQRAGGLKVLRFPRNPGSLGSDDRLPGYYSRTPNTAEDALISRMELEALHVVHVHHDQHSLFRAIAYQIYGDEERHTELFRRCAEHLRRYFRRFEVYCTGSIEDHLTAINRCLAVPGDLEIRALEEVLDRVCYVYSVDTYPEDCHDIPKSTNIDECGLLTGIPPVRIFNFGNGLYYPVIDQCGGIPFPLEERKGYVLVRERIRLFEYMFVVEKGLNDV